MKLFDYGIIRFFEFIQLATSKKAEVLDRSTKLNLYQDLE